MMDLSEEKIEELERKLENCRNINLKEFDKDSIPDITEIYIDENKPYYERVIEFIDKYPNPYVFKCNGRLIKIEFSNNGTSADKAIIEVMKKNL